MTTLLIDCHAICHAAKHTLGDLSFEEQKVGIIFGFMKRLLSLSKEFDTNRFLFCWDSKKSYRRGIYPSYKNRNPLTSEEQEFEKFAFKQFIELRSYTLPKFGFRNNFIQTGLEADDIIATIIKNYEGEFVIASGDSDFFQLLSDNVSMYLPRKNKLFTKEHFTKEYDIEPIEWVKVKQIGGCRSDKVKGIKGVAEKTAIKYLKDLMNKKTKTYQNIVNGQEIIERNEALVKLPFEGTKVPKIVKNERFYFNNFMSLINKYGFRSFKQNRQLNEWQTQFKME